MLGFHCILGKQVNSIALARGGTGGDAALLCSCSSDGSIKLWEALSENGKCVGTMHEHSDYGM